MTKYLTVFLSILILAGCRSADEPSATPVVDVKLARVEQADVALSLRAPASIWGRQQASLNARLTAPIRRLLVRKGDTVASGQLLAQLDDRDLVAQRDEAAAALAEAQANLARVSSATVPGDIERARGQLAVSEAALNQARRIHDRRADLFRQGAIPQRDLLLSQTELAQTQANYNLARSSLDLLLNQSREKDIRIAQSHLDQARAHLALLSAQLGFTSLHSPFSGTITEQFLFAGDMAKPDAPIFTLVDLDVAVARAQVPESEARSLRPGLACAFVPSDQPSASFPGRLTVVNQAVDAARRTIETWCEIPNPGHHLRAGAFGSLRITTGSAPQSTVVPLAAVQFVEGTRRGTVVVAGPDSLAHQREVSAGELFDGRVQILSGLKPGERVVVEGNYGLPDGARLRWPEERTR
jgi:HlyD family secretion protein